VPWQRSSRSSPPLATWEPITPPWLASRCYPAADDRDLQGPRAGSVMFAPLREQGKNGLVARRYASNSGSPPQSSRASECRTRRAAGRLIASGLTTPNNSPPARGDQEDAHHRSLAEVVRVAGVAPETARMKRPRLLEARVKARSWRSPTASKQEADHPDPGPGEVEPAERPARGAADEEHRVRTTRMTTPWRRRPAGCCAGGTNRPTTRATPGSGSPHPVSTCDEGGERRAVLPRRRRATGGASRAGGGSATAANVAPVARTNASP